MGSVFPRLYTRTFHLCLLLPLTPFNPLLLPFVLGAAVPYTRPTLPRLLFILFLSFLLDGHSLASVQDDPALASRFPLLHFDPRRTSGLLQLSAVSVFPLIWLIGPSDVARIYIPSGHAAALAALLALLSYTSNRIPVPSIFQLKPRPTFPHPSLVLQAVLKTVIKTGITVVCNILPGRLHIKRASAVFNLRTAISDFLKNPSRTPIDSIGAHRALVSIVMALIGAIDESAYLHHEEWLDTATSIAGVTGSTLVLADMDAEGTNARIVRVVVIMLFVRIARAIANIKMLRDILMPIAAVGANIPWVWSIVQYRGVELALDAARFNGEGSLLTVTRGACEVLAFGDGQRAYYLWLMVRSALIAIAAWAFERRYNNSAEG